MTLLLGLEEDPIHLGVPRAPGYCGIPDASIETDAHTDDRLVQARGGSASGRFEGDSDLGRTTDLNRWAQLGALNTAGDSVGKLEAEA